MTETISFHPEAKRRLDERAEALVVRNSQDWPERPTEGFQRDVYIAGTIGPEDIVGPLVETETDRFGEEIGRRSGGSFGVFALSGDAHQEFVSLADGIHQGGRLHDVVSVETIRSLLFTWLWGRWMGQSVEQATDYVVRESQLLVGEYAISIPIFSLYVEQDLAVGNIVFSAITAEELDSWEDMAKRQAVDQTDAVENRFLDLRRRLQGSAAARFATRAEERRAYERAVKETELAVGLLRLVSPGAFLPERPTLMAPIGKEYQEKEMAFTKYPTGFVGLREGIVHAEKWHVIIDGQWAERAVLPTIQYWSALLRKTQRSEFEDEALKSVMLYSKATTYRNISEKLIHVFAAIEALLLRNDNEPIVSGLADRLAFAVGGKPHERKAIAKRVRKVYSMRSGFVHHGRATGSKGEDLATVENFLMDISQFYVNLGSNLHRFGTRLELIEGLENLKYGFPPASERSRE